MTLYLSNRDGNGKTSEEGHYKFQTSVFTGNVLGSTALKVTQNSPLGMSVLVASGQYRIPTVLDYSYTGWNSSTKTIAISPADAANPRITSIILYVDKSASTAPSPPNNPNVTKLTAVNGLPASTPTVPNSSTIQSAIGATNPYIVLANIRVNAGATSITNSFITDTRELVAIGPELVTSSSLGINSVTNNNIADNSINGSKISNNSIPVNKLLDGSILDSKWRNSIAFYARRDVARNIAASTFSIFGCEAVEYNYGGGYGNPSGNSVFTAPVAGIYTFNATLNTGAVTVTRAIIELRKNDSTLNSRVSDFTGSNINQTNGTRTVLLNPGDTIKPFAWASAAVNIASGQTQSSFVTDFSGYLVTRV